VTPEGTRPLIAAIYARVSTEDQNYDMQLREVREYVGRMGWQAVEYAEKVSSVKRRPVLSRLMEDARHHKIDVVVVWKLDRFARSLQQLIENVQALDSAGVRFIALTQGIDTDRRNPASRLLLQILGAIAEFERGIIVERVTAGVRSYKADYAAGRVGKERTSKSGKNLAPHRPKRVFRRDLAAKMRADGKSFRSIAKELGVPVSTIVDALKPAK
jgi:DNA invertase Pin-like site-specific DNA recombinase